MERLLKRTISTAEIARELSKAPVIVRRMLREGKIPALQVGSRYIVSRAAFDSWMSTLGMPRQASARDRGVLQ